MSNKSNSESLWASRIPESTIFRAVYVVRPKILLTTSSTLLDLFSVAGLLVSVSGSFVKLDFISFKQVVSMAFLCFRSVVRTFKKMHKSRSKNSTYDYRYGCPDSIRQNIFQKINHLHYRALFGIYDYTNRLTKDRMRSTNNSNSVYGLLFNATSSDSSPTQALSSRLRHHNSSSHSVDYSIQNLRLLPMPVVSTVDIRCSQSNLDIAQVRS